MDPRHSAGTSAYGSAGASGQFDPATFIRKPQVLLRMIAVVSWFHMALRCHWKFHRPTGRATGQPDQWCVR